MLGRYGSAELWLGAAPGKRTSSYDGPVRAELITDLVERGELVPVAVEGVRGERFVIAEEMPWLDAAERDAAGPPVAAWAPRDPEASGVALLAPLDPFVWDRDFLRTLFDFDYIWEVYVPEAKRRWGYYVLPILWGDRLVGRIEPRIDRAADAVRILGVHWQAGFDPQAHPAFLGRLAEALEAHRAFAGTGRILLPRTGPVARLRGGLTPLLPALGRPARRTSIRPKSRLRASAAS
jgi:uncharacterized protein YcaQ